jgi:hypothetical protein
LINELYQLQKDVMDDEESSLGQLHVDDVFNDSVDIDIHKLHEYSDFVPNREHNQLAKK